ncbi:MAG: hypothetical protein ACRETM_06945, partial [Stenotrophobium sp.]
DNVGNVWTATEGGQIDRNGHQVSGGGTTVLLLDYNRTIYTEYTMSGRNLWFSWNGSSWTYLGLHGDPRGSGTVLNGACGASNGATLSSVPSTNLCSAGAISAVSGSGPWSWSCGGSSGGASAQCLAPLMGHFGRSIPATLFGMQTHGPQDTWPTVSFGIMGKGSHTIWPYVEPSRGVWDWSALDQYVAATAAHNISFMYTFEGIPAWAISGASTATCGTLYTGQLMCASLPNNMADWTNYVTTLVTRYCPGGVPKIQYYELWNEPYDVYGTKLVQLSPAALAKLTHAAYGIIRSKCPAAKILTPDFSTVPGSSYATSTYTSIAAYAPAYFSALGPVGTDPADIAAVHIYTYNQAVNKPEDIIPDGSLNSATTNSVFAKYVPGKPIWNTEGSWLGDTGLFASNDLHAAFIARWYILHWAAGYESANWYAWDDGADGTLCGGLHSPCTVLSTIPTTAYTQTYNWLVGKIMSNGCSKASDGVTWSCKLAGPNGYTGLIVWDTAGSKSYTPPSASLYKQYRDLSGKTTGYSGGAVTIAVKPILLEN